MQLLVQGQPVFAATGGRAHQAGMPFAALVHGAGFDHCAWALQSRWLAFHGWNVLAPDLPGHGRSGGAPLSSVPELAAWLLDLLAAAGARRATLIGHSMGSLVALQAAAGAPELVERLVLIGTAAAMAVHPELLRAAQRGDPAAIDMVNLWGHGATAGLGGSRVPGLWMTGLGARILERAAPGVLHRDLAACDAYRDALLAAAAVRAPTLVIAGGLDRMTPAKQGRALAAAIAQARFVELPGAGHMLMVERPDELRQLLAAHLGVTADARARVGASG